MLPSLAFRRHRTVAGLTAIAITAAGITLGAQRPAYTHIHWRLLSSVATEDASGEGRQSGPPSFVIPPAVQALDGQMVVIEGFMIPLDITPAGVSLFVLNGDSDQCDFGVPPRVIDWILVSMTPGQRAPFSHLPTTVRGRLEVGPQIRNGRVTSLYRLAADRVTVQGGFGDR